MKEYKWCNENISVKPYDPLCPHSSADVLFYTHTATLNSLWQAVQHVFNMLFIMSSFPLSASVVSVEDMDRQPLSSPEGKKVSYASLSLSLLPVAFPDSHPPVAWTPSGPWCSSISPAVGADMPDSVWRPAWHPKDPGELWAQAAGAPWESILSWWWCSWGKCELLVGVGL